MSNDQQSSPPAAAVDARLLDAAVSVLEEVGWDGLTQERVAERAGVSRVTTWRQGVTRERLIGALLDRLGEDFRSTLWPVLTASGSGAQRLVLGLDGLCDVIDRNAPLLDATNRAFHFGFREEYGAAPINFGEPYARFLTEGAADGSLRQVDGDVAEQAEVVFNTLCWTYLHLRSAHEVPSDRARKLVIDLITLGLVAHSEGKEATSR